MADFANMQSAGDGDAAATITQNGGPTGVVATATTGSSGVTDASDALPAVDDDAWAVIDSGDVLDIRTFDTGSSTGTITSVEIIIDGHRDGSTNGNADTLDVEVRNGGSWDSEHEDWLPQMKPGSAPFDERLVVNITDREAEWDWAEVAALRVRLDYDPKQRSDNMDFNIDSFHIRVSTADPYSLDMRLDWDDLPVGSMGELQLRYQVTADTYHVEVYDGTTWNTRGATLDQGTWTTWTYTLTEAEKSGCVGPCIRIIDDTPGSTSGTIEIDYARVRDT